MRALRVVGYGEDDSGQPRVILEDPDRRERFSVAADERLRAAARGDVQRLGQMIASSSELESQLRPREIQARIRAGASVEQVAAEAGVALQRIERFAYPVLLERSRTADLARAAHPIRPDGPDVRTLEEVVSHTFGLRGQDYQEAAWDSWRGEDNKWVVTLSWRVGHSDITARWTYHPGAHGGTVTALDEHALDLIDGNARPPRRVGPVVDFSKPETPSKPETSSKPEPPSASEPGTANSARGSAGGSRVGSADGGPATDTGATARATGTDQPGRRATKTTTGPGAASARAGEDTSDRDGTSSPAADSPADTRSSADPPGPADATSGDAPKRGGRKAKPVMPSWEDVLLGVKRS
jgi:hypothetical protein